MSVEEFITERTCFAIGVEGEFILDGASMAHRPRHPLPASAPPPTTPLPDLREAEAAPATHWTGMVVAMHNATNTTVTVSMEESPDKVTWSACNVSTVTIQGPSVDIVPLSKASIGVQTNYRFLRISMRKRGLADPDISGLLVCTAFQFLPVGPMNEVLS